MNILIFSSWYPHGDSISGVFVKEQVSALKSIGKTPVVFFPYDDTLEKNKLTVSMEEGVKTYRANTDYLNNSKLSRINSIIKSVKFLKKIVKDNNIDIIHCHVCYPSGFTAMIYKKLYKTPYIITEHMSHVPQYSEKIYNKFLFKKSYGAASIVITVSGFLADELRRIGYSFKGMIVGNVVNVPEGRLSVRNQRDTINIISIGLMDITEIKGLRYMLPAIAALKEHNKDLNIRVSFVGGGELMPTYKAIAKELSIEKICKFYGTVPKEEVPEIIRQNDFLVVSSLKETFGSVIIEAMAEGKPVLATTCGGPQEFINEDTGMLVKPGSSEELEKGMERMIENLDKFDSENIRQYIRDNYSYEAIGNTLEGIYGKILNEN